MPLIQWIMQNLSTVAEANGVVVGGSADVVQVFSDVPTDGAVVGGQADVFVVHIDDEAASGVIAGGSAIESVDTTGEIGEGVVAGGTAIESINHIYDESNGVTGGVVVGGGAVIQTDQVCDKYLLPNHPKPSTADYTPSNIAPLIEFFTPIVSSVLGQNLDKCQVIFRYENNTPCEYDDDIFVKHPTCLGQQYNPEPKPTVKSPELLKYEEYAKKSERLKEFMNNSPAKIEYFVDL